MIKFFKKIRWLINHQEEIEVLLKQPKEKKKKDDSYSLAGVPAYQLEYIQKELLKDK